MNLVILLTPIINIYRIISWISVLGKLWKITGEGKHTCTKSMTHNNTLWKQVNFMQSLRWVCHFTSSKFQQAAVFTLTNQNYFTGIIQLENTSNNSNLTSNSVWYFMSHIYHLCFLYFVHPIQINKSRLYNRNTSLHNAIQQHKLQLPKWSYCWNNTFYIKSALSWRENPF